jgi:hypothetical protein
VPSPVADGPLRFWDHCTVFSGSAVPPRQCRWLSRGLAVPARRQGFAAQARRGAGSGCGAAGERCLPPDRDATADLATLTCWVANCLRTTVVFLARCLSLILANCY